MEAPLQSLPKARGKKLFYLLAKLSVAEQVQLGHWLASPLHGNSSQFVGILDILLRHLQQDDPPELSAEMFQHLLTPNRDLDGKKAQYIWIRLSQFYSEVLNFIAWTRYNQNIPAQKTHLLEEVCQRGWEKLIPETYEAGLKAQPPMPNARRFRDELELEIQYCQYLAGVGNRDKHLAEIHASLDHHFLLQKLKYACAGVLEGDLTADPTVSPVLSMAIDYVSEHFQFMPKVIQAYFHAFKMLRIVVAEHSMETAHYKPFEELFANPQDFSADEAMDLYVHGQNFCVLGYRRGNAELIDNLEMLYDKVLDSGIATVNGLMPPPFYLNAAELMGRLGRLAWVEIFIENYKDRVAHDPNKLAFHYCLALVRFYQRRFSEVPKILYNILGKLDLFDVGTSGRLMVCQSLWEIQDWEWLGTNLVAFHQFLVRKKDIQEDRKKNFLRFVHYLKVGCEAMASLPGKRRKKLDALLVEIETKEPANTFQWMRSKVAEAIADSN